MKIDIHSLRHYVALPQDDNAIRDLMDDIGLEVKKSEQTDEGPVFTLELLANRGDHRCYVGVAREIHGRTGWRIVTPVVADAPVAAGGNVEVSTDNCMNYVLCELRRREDAVVALDTAKTRMLVVGGANTVTPPVDITNFVNIEIGQPLHAFDADKIVGRLRVREADMGETAHLLFSDAVVKVPKGTIVVSDDKRILAIAGVMGCEDAKPDEHTDRIYLESATFDPVMVRKAARHAGIQSQCSMRFERGAHPSLALAVAQRAVMQFSKAGSDLHRALWHAKAWR